MDRSKSFQVIHRNKGYNEYLVETEVTLLKKSNYDCVEDNSFSFKDCINEFISNQIGCSLPWIKTVIKKRQCTSKQDLDMFRNLSIHLTSPKARGDISKNGCFKPNCRKRTWIKNEYDETWYQFEENTTTLYINIPATATVLKRTEILLADMSTFVADCGSYLSLFLGASVLSLTDLMISFFKRISLATSGWIFQKKRQKVDQH